MNVRTCYRCPERHPEYKPEEGKWDRRKRCPILQGPCCDYDEGCKQKGAAA